MKAQRRTFASSPSLSSRTQAIQCQRASGFGHENGRIGYRVQVAFIHSPKQYPLLMISLSTQINKVHLIRCIFNEHHTEKRGLTNRLEEGDPGLYVGVQEQLGGGRGWPSSLPPASAELTSEPRCLQCHTDLQRFGEF